MPRYRRYDNDEISPVDILLLLTAAWIFTCISKLYTFFRGNQPFLPNNIPHWLTASVLIGWITYFAYQYYKRQSQQRQWQKQLQTWLPTEKQLQPQTIVTLDQLKALSPQQFEKYVELLFQKRGYYTILTPHLADHGVDIYVSKEGTNAIVQCKKYERYVSEPAIRDFYGTIMHENANKGFFVTTGYFSYPAQAWAKGKPIELINGPHLLRIAKAINLHP